MVIRRLHDPGEVLLHRTLLPGGKVLMTAGTNGSLLATCELFDPRGNLEFHGFAFPYEGLAHHYTAF